MVQSYTNRFVRMLIAESSYEKPFLHFFAKLFGAVPIKRAMDYVKPGSGVIVEVGTDYIKGEGTSFLKEL